MLWSLLFSTNYCVSGMNEAIALHFYRVLRSQSRRVGNAMNSLCGGRRFDPRIHGLSFVLLTILVVRFLIYIMKVAHITFFG